MFQKFRFLSILCAGSLCSNNHSYFSRNKRLFQSTVYNPTTLPITQLRKNPRCPQSFLEVQGTSKKFRKRETSSRNFRNVQEFFEKFKEFRRFSSNFQEFHGTSESSGNFQEVQVLSKNFRDLLELSGSPRNF